MKVESKEHNTLKNNNETITFINGIPGFITKRDFIFLCSDKNWPFIIMQSIEEKKLAFVTIDPWKVREDYKFEISDSVQQKLKIETPDDVFVLAICTIRDKMKNMTVNLAAPVVINYKERFGMQVVLDNTDYQIRYPVFSAYSEHWGRESACTDQKRR